MSVEIFRVTTFAHHSKTFSSNGWRQPIIQGIKNQSYNISGIFREPTILKKKCANSGCTTLFRAGLLKVNRIFRSAPSSHFRCMSNEAFQLYFF